MTVKELSANTGDKELKELHDIDKLDSGMSVRGILEVMPDGYGLSKRELSAGRERYLCFAISSPGIFSFKTGDILEGNTRIKNVQEKFSALYT